MPKTDPYPDIDKIDPDQWVRIEAGIGRELDDVLGLYHEIILAIEEMEYSIGVIDTEKKMKSLHRRVARDPRARISREILGYPMYGRKVGKTGKKKFYEQQRKGEVGLLTKLEFYLERLRNHGVITKRNDTDFKRQIRAFRYVVKDYDLEVVGVKELADAFFNTLAPDDMLSRIRTDITRWMVVGTYDEIDAWTINEDVVHETIDLLRWVTYAIGRTGWFTEEDVEELNRRADQIEIALQERVGVDYYDEVYSLLDDFRDRLNVKLEGG